MSFKGSNKSKSWNSTEKYRNLAQGAMDSWRPEAMQMIDQSTSDTMAALTSGLQMQSAVNDQRMGAGMAAAGVDPMSAMTNRGDFQSQMVGQLLQAKGGVLQNMLSAKLGVGEQDVQNQLQLAGLSGGNKSVQKQGWGQTLGAGLQAVGALATGGASLGFTPFLKQNKIGTT